jgi:[acyl-carrier-protein] S-malonyltransferase
VTIAILCSGQGHQAKGMFAPVADAVLAQPVFAAASIHLGGQDPRALVDRGNFEQLHVDATAQILCCTQALAVASVLNPRIDDDIVVAGYSVGEVAAWGVAGALNPMEVFALVAQRAALMDKATDGPAGLLSLRGLSPAKIDRICQEADVQVAIRIANDHVIVGGRQEALMRARASAENAGAAAVTALPVEVPSHTPLLREAANQFADVLRACKTVRQPQARLISGIDGGAVFDLENGLSKLARQVAETVDWAACMEACRSAGAARALELGPGDALARMMSSVLDEGDCRSVSEFRTIDGIVRWVNRGRRSTASTGGQI